MSKRYLVRLMAVASIFLVFGMLGGCAKKTVQTEESVSTAVPEQPAPPPEEPKEPEVAMGSEESLETPPVTEKMEPRFLEGRTSAPMLPVYFDFDKSVIRDDQKPRIIGNAEYLKANPQIAIRVEGNCDERGTNEYNMALGERRAKSGKKYLTNLGIAADRIKTISFGEEKPLNYGHDESAWSQNRRDDFVITE